MLGDKALAADRRFAGSPARLANREALHAEIDRVFRALTASELIEKLDAADIANARLNSMADFWHHAQLAARERWASVASPAGPIQALKPPFNLSGCEPRMGPVPALGEQTGALLAELGYTRDEIEGLRAEGVI